MSSKGPVIEPEDLRKNVSGIVFGSMPASLTCDTKFVICATTRHGAVTGEISVEAVDRHGIGGRGRGVNGAAIGQQFARGGRRRDDPRCAGGVWTYQASAVRRTETVMRWQLSAGRAGG